MATKKPAVEGNKQLELGLENTVQTDAVRALLVEREKLLKLAREAKAGKKRAELATKATAAELSGAERERDAARARIMELEAQEGGGRKPQVHGPEPEPTTEPPRRDNGPDYGPF